MRSMIVGMDLTGVCSKAPPNRSPGRWVGTQLGTSWARPLGPVHGVTRSLSQPHPGPGVTPLAGTGLSPKKLSADAATMSVCPAQEAESPEERVWSLIAKCCARAVMLGTWDG